MLKSLVIVYKSVKMTINLSYRTKRHKIGAASDKDMSKGALQLENDLAELESR